MQLWSSDEEIEIEVVKNDYGHEELAWGSGRGPVARSVEFPGDWECATIEEFYRQRQRNENLMQQAWRQSRVSSINQGKQLSPQ